MTNGWTSLKAPTVQEAQDGCSGSSVGGKVVRVGEGMILKLGEEEGGVNVGVSVVDLRVVRWGTARPERRHGMGPSVFTQSPQCRRVRAEVRPSQTDPEAALWASHYGRGPSHGGQQEGVWDGVGKGRVQGVCRRQVGVWVRRVVLVVRRGVRVHCRR